MVFSRFRKITKKGCKIFAACSLQLNCSKNVLSVRFRTVGLQTPTRLLDRMENGDVLIVTKLDRLGRNAMDIRKTVELLAGSEIRVHCLALGGVDLTSPAGNMTMQVISAVAEFERDLLIERTHSGIARARASGKRFGRPSALNDEQKQLVLERLNMGMTVSAVAREFSTTRQTILRVKTAVSES